MTTAVFLISFGYYALLSAKDYTWLFASQDSGDWLAASTMWFAPQPLGSPLYVLAGHFLNLFPGDLPAKMTILLSVLPSTITVTLVYLIVLRLTANKRLAAASSLILLGTAVFLTQSTVLEEYALATMFAVLAFWLYLQGRRKLTLLALGLGTAIHIMVPLLVLAWLIAERQSWRAWLKISWVYALAGILPYIMIPMLMARHEPPFMAGYLSWGNLYEYVFETSGSVFAQISVIDFPLRVATATGHLLASLGLAVIPLAWALTKPWDRTKWVLALLAGVPLAYYLFCIDPSTWTFLTFAAPFAAVLAGLGLQRLKTRQSQAVLAGAMLLIVLNGIFLNAGQITRNEAIAEEVRAEMMALPDGSGIICIPGDYSMCAMYCIAEGKDLVPIIWKDDYARWPRAGDMQGQYKDYCKYMYHPLGIDGSVPLDAVSEALQVLDNVYVVGPEWMLDKGIGDATWTDLMTLLDMEKAEGRIRKVRGFNGEIQTYQILEGSPAAGN